MENPERIWVHASCWRCGKYPIDLRTAPIDCHLCGLPAVEYIRADLAAPDIAQLEATLRDERMEHDLLKELLSRPQIDDFWEGIVAEAGHQRQRWGEAHDRSKSAENWYWLVGYLAGKALRATIDGDMDKAKHHTISAAAALFQWHQAITADESGCGLGDDRDLVPPLPRPSDEPLRDAIDHGSL